MSLPHFDSLLERDATHACQGYGRDHVCVRIAAAAELPTRFGDFHVVGFGNPLDGKEHAAFVHGQEALDGEAVPVRIHSECLTGDAIGSLRCDCRDQLEASLRAARPDALRDPAVPAPGGPRDRADEQDPGLRAPGSRPRHGRGEHRPRFPRRRARLLDRGAHAALARCPVRAPDDQQPAEDRRPSSARGRGRRSDPARDPGERVRPARTSRRRPASAATCIDDRGARAGGAPRDGRRRTLRRGAGWAGRGRRGRVDVA